MTNATTSWVLIGALLAPPQNAVASCSTPGLPTRLGSANTDVSEEEQAREERVVAALHAYDDGDFVAAAEHFEAAYAVAGRPEDLFNAGRAHEEAGHPEQARRYYERFLDAPGVSENHRAETQRRIDELPPPPELAQEAVPLAPVVPVQSDQRPTNQGGRSHRKIHWATAIGIGLIPAGAAGLATGGVFAAVAMQNAENARASRSDERASDDVPQRQLAERQAKMADGMLLAGGVVLAAGLVFLLSGLEYRRGSKTRRRRHQRRVRAGASGLTLSF